MRRCVRGSIFLCVRKSEFGLFGGFPLVTEENGGANHGEKERLTELDDQYGAPTQNVRLMLGVADHFLFCDGFTPSIAPNRIDITLREGRPSTRFIGDGELVVCD